jgi:hypothetical protein
VKLLSQFGAVGVAVSGDRVLGGSLQHFELPTPEIVRVQFVSLGKSRQSMTFLVIFPSLWSKSATQTAPVPQQRSWHHQSR